jgi:PAS domain S-box-containing protein
MVAVAITPWGGPLIAPGGKHSQGDFAMSQSTRILIVDRDRRTRTALSGALAALGHACALLDTERGVLDRLRAERFDLLLIDPMAPLLDLKELLATMREEGIATRTMALVPAGEADASWGKLYPDLAGALERPDGGPCLKAIMQQATNYPCAVTSTGSPNDILAERFNNQLQATFDAAPDLIVLLDKKRRVLFANAHMLQARRLSLEQVVGKDCHAALCGEDHKAEDCPFGQAIDKADADLATLRRCLWGMHFDIHSAPLVDRFGEHWGVMDVMHDVSNLVEAEQALRRRLEVERLAVNISSRFVGDTDLNQAIDHALARVGYWSRADRAYLFQFAADAQTMTNTHEWHAAGVEPLIDRMQAMPSGKYLWLMAQLCGQKTIYIDDVSKMPQEAMAEREFFSTSMTKSLVALSVHVGDRVAGFLGLDNVHDAREWREEDRAILRMVAEVIGNALDRAQTEMRHLLLATAVEQLAELIMVTDSRHVIEYVNPAFEAITGYTSAHAIGRHPRELFPLLNEPAEKERQLIETIESGRVWSMQHLSKRADGSIYEGAFTICPVVDGSGKVVNQVMIGRDVTEQVKLEAQLRQAQKLESIGQLAAGVAHEINTPIQYVADNARFLKDAFLGLTGLLGAYHALLDEAEQGTASGETVKRVRKALDEADVDYYMEEVPQAVDQSLEGIGRVAKIVRAMKEFSYPGSLKQTSIDLNHAIESTVEVCRNEWKYVAEMELDLDKELPPVHCYPGELSQSLLNLIVNAAHAIGEAIGKKQAVKGRIRVSTRKIADMVQIQVADTGTGISPDVRGKIFDPFFTTKEVGKGTGQGLAIVYAVIHDKHHGRIEFETELGRGTTFTLSLPIAGQETDGAGDEREATARRRRMDAIGKKDGFYRDGTESLLPRAGPAVNAAADAATEGAAHGDAQGKAQ